MMELVNSSYGKIYRENLKMLSLSVNSKGRKCLFWQIEYLYAYDLIHIVNKFDEKILIFLYTLKKIKEGSALDKILKGKK